MGNVLQNIRDSFRKLFENKEARILLLGIDAAGKTTILYQLYQGETVETIPTIGFNVEQFTMWDVGGQHQFRPLWRHYYTNSDAVIFVIDSNDTSRIEEARESLWNVMKDDTLKDAVLLIFANKQDLPNAMNLSDVKTKLKLDKMKQDWFLQPCCGLTGEGLFEGLDWVSNKL